MPRWHLTSEEKQEIRELTRKRVRQSEIARALGITAPSVSRAQREMGLPTRLVWPEKKTLTLLRSGLGQHRIAKRLHVPVNQVHAIMRKHNFQRKHNSGLADPQADVAGFIEAVKRRDDHIIRLAGKFHIGLVKANRLAHEVLQTIKFRPGASKPALSSAFPQKHFGPRVSRKS